MSMVEARYQHLLDDLADRSMLRTLRMIESAQEPKVMVDGREYLLLCSNNYLGLANHPALIEASVRATRGFGAGSGASRLVSGSMKQHHQLEERIAAFKGTESALVFNSGYAANTGILQGLLGPNDVIFSDALNHASIIDGCRLSQAKVVVYPHNDVAVLRGLMEAEERGVDSVWLVVTDGVFSMDGDVAPLAELADLKDEFDALLMVDDAHGTGVLGDTGRGSAEAAGCLDKIDLHMGTLGKALGSFGAFLAAKRVLVDTLINRSRSFIFSTSLPPGVLAAGMEAFDIVDSQEGMLLRQNLAAKRQRVSSQLLAAGADTLGSTTQIIPILTRDPEPTMRFATELLDDGILLQGIRPPTVAEGSCRLRATLMATHDDVDLDRAVDAVIACMDRDFLDNKDD